MFRLSAAALTLFVVLSAQSDCAHPPSSNPQAPAASAASGSFTAEAEWIELKGLEERIVRERGRVVVVNYWATWCEPCREEFPEFVEFHRQWSERGVTFLSVSLDVASVRDTEVKKFLAEQRVPFPIYIRAAAEDPNDFINAIDRKWTGELPATFVYDREGRRALSLFGKQTRKSLEAAVEPFLAVK
ncbi:MAG: TlpA family protein disulfide reductase [Acidobacteria bacterium]|nr:TlpA family protein disulfide reductase [Acidobacteriota bacterium]